MQIMEALRKRSFYLALTGAVVFWILLGISIYLHPGFSFFSPDQSLSDLGKKGANYSYVFNSAIIITATMYFLAVVGMLGLDTSRLRKFAIYIFLLALVAYIGIAVNPKGTSLHIPMTLAFFGLSSIAIILWSVSMLKERYYVMGTIFIALLVSSYFVYFNYNIFGFPFAEAYAGAIIMTWVLTTAKILQKNEN